MNTTAAIREFVVDSFLFGDDQGLTEKTSLFDSGIVDSTGILEMVAFVEERYAMTVGDDELIPENFETVAAIARYVDMKNGKHAASSRTVAPE
jgi:acyl carrier protein